MYCHHLCKLRSPFTAKRNMIFECNVCQKILYVEEEFVDHIKTVHLDEVEDEIAVTAEMITLYSDLKKAKMQEDELTMEAARSAVEKSKPLFHTVA